MYTADEDKTDFETVLKKFSDHCEPRTNVVFERHLFFERPQEADESVDSYVTSQRNLATSCDYGALEDGPILTQLIRGIRDENLRLRLL